MVRRTTAASLEVNAGFVFEEEFGATVNFESTLNGNFALTTQSVQATPEKTIRRTIGSADVVLSCVEIHSEDSLELAARTAGPFALLAAHDVHPVLIAQVLEQLGHSPVELAVWHASAA